MLFNICHVCKDCKLSTLLIPVFAKGQSSVLSISNLPCAKVVRNSRSNGNLFVIMFISCVTTFKLEITN